MNFQEIANNYAKTKRKRATRVKGIKKRNMMTEAVIRNKNHTKNFPTYQAESLGLMFAEWHLLFPQHKQDMKCTSCRAAVCKFWENMVEEWIEIEQTPKKRNGSKKAKAK